MQDWFETKFVWHKPCDMSRYKSRENLIKIIWKSVNMRFVITFPGKRSLLNHQSTWLWTGIWVDIIRRKLLRNRYQGTSQYRLLLRQFVIFLDRKQKKNLSKKFITWFWRIQVPLLIGQWFLGILWIRQGSVYNRL